jgi:hypothetical protein
LGNNRPLLCTILLAFSGLAGCGGGSVGSSTPLPPPIPPPPPPPAPQGDFTIAPASTTLTIQQQGVPQFQSFFITPLNGFTGIVSVTISGLPTGVTAAPAGPYSASTTLAAVLQLSASSTAAVASTTITVTGTSGSITHTNQFTLAVTPVAPFTVQVKPTSLSLKPGQLASVQISLSASAGTNPSLFANVSNPPPGSGITVNGPEFLLSTSNPVSFSVIVGVSAESLQSFPLQVSATDNSGNTSQVTLPLTVSVPSATLGVTRSTFFGTGSAPTGAVYDAARKLIFVTVQSLNEVNVYSSTSGQRMATIPTEQPIGIDETADGTKVIVGAQSAYVTVIDPDLLQVIQKVPAPPVPNPFNGETDYFFLTRPATLSNGQVLFTAQHGYSTESHVFLWDPATGTMTLDDFPGALIYAQVLTRSEDHSKVLIYGVSSTGATAALYDSASSSYTATGSFNGAYYLALSPTGSQVFAAGIQGNATGFYNDSFTSLASLTLEIFPVSGTLYSRDGQHVYVSGTLGTGNVIASLNTNTYSVEGVVPDVAEGSDATVPFDIDETGMIFGGSSGLDFVDLSSPGFFTYPTPSIFQVQPALLNLSAATPVSLGGSLFDQTATYSVFFGTPPASGAAGQGKNLSVQSATALSVTAPAQALPGPVNVTLTRASDGWFQVLPQAATYGPNVFSVAPNAGPASGGASVILYGYGLAESNTQVTIGGKPAQISQAIGNSSVAFDPLVVTAPPGSPGYADIRVTTPAGSTTVPNGFQYLESATVYPVTGALDDIVYDQTRHRLYATNQPLNRVEIFDLNSLSYLTPIPVGHVPIGLAITPDASLLAVVNSSDGTISKINLSTGQVAATYPALTANDLGTGCQGVVFSIASVAPHRMMIDGTCEALAFSGLMHILNLDTGVLSCAGFVTCGTNGTDILIGSGLQAMSTTPDGEMLFMTDTSGDAGAEGGLVTLINVAANTAAENEFGGDTDSAASADANVFATNFGLHDAKNIQFNVASDLQVLGVAAQSEVTLTGEKLNPSGSLLFVPQGANPQTNGLALGVDIFDVHTGRLALRAVLPEQIPPSLNAMALDETGTKMFVISNSGITIATLFQAPLSVAHLTPNSGASGAQVTIRGSGFQTGSTVQFAKSPASVTFVDNQTLLATVPTLPSGPVQVTVTNPNGTSYSFDAAFTVN